VANCGARNLSSAPASQPTGIREIRGIYLSCHARPSGGAPNPRPSV
jgi:hypothetical protein